MDSVAALLAALLGAVFLLVVGVVLGLTRHDPWHGHGPLNKEKAIKCPSLSFVAGHSEAFNQDRPDSYHKGKRFGMVLAAVPMLLGLMSKSKGPIANTKDLRAEGRRQSQA